MKYRYREEAEIKKQGNLWEYMKGMDACNQRNMDNIQNLILIARKAGLDETEKCLLNSLNEMERANMWIRAGVSTITNTGKFG